MLLLSWCSLSREPWMRLSLVRPDDGWFPGIGQIRKECGSINQGPFLSAIAMQPIFSIT
jgi:hypothetical protein